MNYTRMLIIAGGFALGILSLVVTFSIVDPTPPERITMTTGPAGSAAALIGEEYRHILAESGIELVLQPSAGARENLERMSRGESDLGFLTMGTPDASQQDTLRSLGAMYFEPLWIFTTAPKKLDFGFEDLNNSKWSIGPPGSRTNSATRLLLELNGVDTTGLKLLELPPIEAAERLAAGEIQVVSMVSDAASQVLRDLLGMEDATLVDFNRADAYVALFPELRKLIVPAGIGSIAKNLPPHDTRILAFTTMLGVQEDLHAITQSLILDAATKVHSVPGIFHTDASFPLSVHQIIPLSDSAAAYYADGRPLLLRFLPYWLAVFIMQILTAAIPLLAVIYPLMNYMPSFFDWFMRRQLYQVYVELRRIDQIVQSADKAQLETFENRLDEMERRATSMRVPVTYAAMLYGLKTHIGGVRQKINNARQRLVENQTGQ